MKLYKLLNMQALTSKETAQVIYNVGYFLGGKTTSTVYSSVIHKFPFDTKTCTKMSIALSQKIYKGCCVSNFSNGYVLGGYTGSKLTSIEKLAFSTDIRSLLSSTLSLANYVQTGLMNLTYGYSCGGYSGTTVYSSIERFVFSTEVCGAISNTLASPIRSAQGISSRAYGCGYIPGGNTTAVTDITQKMLFNTETSSIISVVLNLARMCCQTLSSVEKGYAAGGNAGGGTTYKWITTIAMATDTGTTSASFLSPIRYNGYGISAADSGYIGGGSNLNDTGTYLKTIDSLNFTTEATGVISAVLSELSFGNNGLSGVYQ